MKLLFDINKNLCKKNQLDISIRKVVIRKLNYGSSAHDYVTVGVAPNPLNRYNFYSFCYI